MFTAEYSFNIFNLNFEVIAYMYVVGKYERQHH